MQAAVSHSLRFPTALPPLLLSTPPPKTQFYEEIHTPGTDAPFKVRGPTYLRDGVKVGPGQPLFELLGMEVVNTGSGEPLPHISRFLPSVRCGFFNGREGFCGCGIGWDVRAGPAECEVGPRVVGMGS